MLRSAVVDQLAYASAFVTALWAFADKHHPPVIPGFLTGISPMYGVAVSSFAGALLIGKHVFMAGEAKAVGRLKNEISQIEKTLQARETTIADITEKLAMVTANEKAIKNRLELFENRDSEAHLGELRKRIREYEDDKKTAATAIVTGMKEQLAELRSVSDEQVLHAVEVLTREIDLLDSEIKKGDTSFYELSLKITDIRENIFDLCLISVSGDAGVRQPGEEGAFNFFRTDTNSDLSSMEQTYKFLKVAFHPDRFSSDSLKHDAKKYFQQTVQAYNSLKERMKA